MNIKKIDKNIYRIDEKEITMYVQKVESKEGFTDGPWEIVVIDIRNQAEISSSIELAKALAKIFDWDIQETSKFLDEFWKTVEDNKEIN